nr:hypothetical protein [Melioribacteraceae bacterium]
MKTQTFLLLIIILSNSLIAQVLSSASEDIEYGEEYYPFNENIELVFDSNIGDAIKSVEILDSLYKTTNISDKFIYSQTLTKQKNGIYIVRTEQIINTFLYSKEVDITYSKPLLHIPLPLKIGMTWNWSGYQIKNGDTTE